MPIMETKLNPVELTGTSAIEEIKFLVKLAGFDQAFAYLEHYFLTEGWEVLKQLESTNSDIYDKIIEFNQQFKNQELVAGRSNVTVVMIAIEAALEAANYHRESSILIKTANNYVHWTQRLFRESRSYFFDFNATIRIVRDIVQNYPIKLTKFHEEFKKLINDEVK